MTPKDFHPHEPSKGEEGTRHHLKLEKHRVRGKQAQQRFRTKNKMKFESLEQEVHTMSDHLRSLERQRAELMAQILKLQPQDPGLSPFKSRLPVIDKVEPPFMPAVSWANFNPEGKGGIILKTIYEQPRRLTREQAKAFSLEDLQFILVEFVAKSGQLLVEHSKEVLQDSSTPPGAKFKELQTERRGLCCVLACWSPFKMLLLEERGFPRGPNPCPLSPPDYKDVLRKLDLSSSQKRALHCAGRKYSDRMQALFLEREVLKAMLERIPMEERPAHGGMSQPNALAYAEAVRKLRDNFDNTYVQKGVLWMTVLHMLESLSYFQEAMWWFEVHPSFPDPALLYTELDKESKEEGSDGMQMVPGFDVAYGADARDHLPDGTPVPYVEVEGKMMNAFENFGLWSMIGEEQAPSHQTG